MKLLFVCNLGRNRSKTAAELLQKKHETKYAGILSESNPLTEDIIRWADKIFCMTKDQYEYIQREFPDLYFRKDIVILNIDDVYYFEQDELIDILKERLRDYLR